MVLLQALYYGLYPQLFFRLLCIFLETHVKLCLSGRNAVGPMDQWYNCSYFIAIWAVTVNMQLITSIYIVIEHYLKNIPR